MPRGKYVNHKGRSRHFTSPEELQQESESENESSSEEGSGDDSGDNAGAAAASTSKGSSNKAKQRVKKMASSSEEDSEESDDGVERDAKKGVASLIEIENPNRSVKKSTQKVSNLSLDEAPKPQLTRREREQLEKQKAKLRYDKLHAEGKTREAKADLARLALIRQQRAEAAAKREAEKKALEQKKATTTGGGKA